MPATVHAHAQTSIYTYTCACRWASAYPKQWERVGGHTAELVPPPRPIHPDTCGRATHPNERNRFGNVPPQAMAGTLPNRLCSLSLVSPCFRKDCWATQRICRTHACGPSMLSLWGKWVRMRYVIALLRHLMCNGLYIMVTTCVDIELILQGVLQNSGEIERRTRVRGPLLCQCSSTSASECFR